MIYKIITSVMILLFTLPSIASLKPVEPCKRGGIEEVTSFVNFNGESYFCGKHPNLGEELFRSDGTPDGTHLVLDISSGVSNSTPSHLFELNGSLFFLTNEIGTGPMLWRTNGTEGGTTLIKRFAPNMSVVSSLKAYGDSQHGFFFYLSTGDSNLPASIWRTNGTKAGTLELDRQPHIWNLTLAKGKLFYWADTFNLKQVPLVGSSKPTLLKSFRPRAIRNHPTIMGQLGGGVGIFTVADDNSGYQLWSSDGRRSGTKFVMFNPLVVNFENKDKWVLCGLYSDELFVTNGTSLSSLGASVDGCFDNSRQRFGTVYSNGKWLITGFGSQTTFTDGTAAGTIQVERHIIPLSRFYSARPTIKGETFFSDDDRNLWKTDGTNLGTTMLKSYPGLKTYDVELVATSEGGYLIDTHPRHYDIWRLDFDGNVYSQSFIKQFKRTGIMSVKGYVGNRLFFSHYNDLWHVNSNPKATFRIMVDAVPISISPIISLLLDEPTIKPSKPEMVD